MITILVVDDMPIIRLPIVNCLQASGYRVLTAASGAKALGLLRTEHPDLILLDIEMPEMDGLRLLQLIRRNQKLKTIPVILLTAESDRQIVLKAVESGAQGYILKASLSLTDLLSRVQKELSVASGIAQSGDQECNQPLIHASAATTLNGINDEG